MPPNPPTSIHYVDNVAENTANAGVTISSLHTGVPPTMWGDDFHDESAAFQSLANAQSATDTLSLGAGSYKFLSNVSVPAYFRPIRGVLLRPRLGVTITFSGGIEDVPFQWIDPTAGGTVAFSGPLSHLRPEWMGMKGNGTNADWAPLLAMTNALPKWTPVKFRSGSNVRLDYAWPILQKQGNTFECDVMPTDAFINNNNCIFQWFGPDTGLMVPNYNSGYCRFRGLSFNPNGAGVVGSSTASVCIDTDLVEIQTTNGVSTVQTQAANQAPGTLGASFFKSLAPNIQIQLTGGGPAGAALVTTIAGVADDQHATLGTTAGQTSSFNQFTLSPAGYAAAPNNNNRISTQCLFEYCQFILQWGQFGRLKESIGVRISKTSQANCEYNVFRHCQFLGTNYVQAIVPQAGNVNTRAFFNTPGGASYGAGFSGWVATTTSNMMTAGSNAIGGFNVDTFSPSMNGMRWRGPGGTADLGARGYSGTSDTDHQKTLDGYFKYLTVRSGALYSDPGLTVPLNAVTTVTKAAPYFMLGECVGIGIQQGPSFNAKRFTTYECHFQSLAIGMDIQGGSAHHLFPNYSDNDINVAMGVSQSEPSSEYGANSETSRCHLFYGSPDGYTIEKSRFAMGMVSPGDGYFKFVSGYGSNLVRFLGNHVENAVPSSSTVFSSSLTVAAATGGTGQGYKMVCEGNRFTDVSGASYAAALSDLGWDDNAMSNGCVIYERENTWTFAPMPEDSIISTTSFSMSNGKPFQYRKGTTFFANQRQPVQTDHLDVPSWASYSTTSGGGLARPFWTHWDGTKLQTKLGLPVTGGVAPSDGATITIDPTQGDFFYIDTAQAAPNFILNASLSGTWWFEGQTFEIMLQNGTAGAINPTWNGGSSGFTNPWLIPTAGFTYPAAGKLRSYRFRVHNGFLYYQSPTADVG